MKNSVEEIHAMSWPEFLVDAVTAWWGNLISSLPKPERIEWYGLSLFGATVAVATLIGGIFRFPLGYAAVFLVGLVPEMVSLVLPVDVSFIELPLIDIPKWMGGVFFTLLPSVRAVIGLLDPGYGHGWAWARRVGARRAAEEEAVKIGSATKKLGVDGIEICVINSHRAFAASLGVMTMVSRVLVKTKAKVEILAAVIGHELGHVNTWDARISEGLRRLTSGEDPLAPIRDHNDLPARLEESNWVIGLLRWVLKGAGGGFALWLFKPLWSWYSRYREFAADAYAVAMGQGRPLLKYWEREDRDLDLPQPGITLSKYGHPPIEFRRERVQALLRGERITWKRDLCRSPHVLAQFLVKFLRLRPETPV